MSSLEPPLADDYRSFDAWMALYCLFETNRVELSPFDSTWYPMSIMFTNIACGIGWETYDYIVTPPFVSP